MSRAFNHMIRCWNGADAAHEGLALFSRLHSALELLGGWQQDDHEEGRDAQQDIRDVVHDVAMALTGETIAFMGRAPGSTARNGFEFGGGPAIELIRFIIESAAPARTMANPGGESAAPPIRVQERMDLLFDELREMYRWSKP